MRLFPFVFLSLSLAKIRSTFAMKNMWKDPQQGYTTEDLEPRAVLSKYTLQ